MAGKSSIEWTEHTWNPIVGCSIVSPGCANCYAMKMAGRIEAMGGAAHYDGTTKPSKAGAVWTGKVAMAPDHILNQPLKRKKPTTYFVNSMGDLFHEDAPDAWIDRVFAVMSAARQHTFQVLTKRAGRMQKYLSEVQDRIFRWDCDAGLDCVTFPLPNVWLGVSTERQQEADERIPLLLQTPASIRFISAEPLIGHLDISDYLVETARTNRDWYLDWVIVGGESGPGARRMEERWARDLRDQCMIGGAAFFFKQWGAHDPETHDFVGTKAAGRMLEGRIHNGMPTVAA